MSAVRYLPSNQYDANIFANSPNMANPYATIADLGGGVSRFGVEDFIATENRIFSGSDTYGFTLNDLSFLNLSVYNGTISTTRFFSDDVTTEFYSPTNNSSIQLTDATITVNSEIFLSNNDTFQVYTTAGAILLNSQQGIFEQTAGLYQLDALTATWNVGSSLILNVYNGSTWTARFYGDDASTEFYSPNLLSSLILTNTSLSLYGADHRFISTGDLSLSYSVDAINQNIQFNYNTAGVGVVYHAYQDTKVITYLGSTVRFEIGYEGEIVMNAPASRTQNLHLNSGTGATLSRIFHEINNVEQLRVEVGSDYYKWISPIGIGEMGSWQMSTGKLNVTGAINSLVGFQVGGAATSGNFLRGNGTNFVSSAIQTSDLQSLSPILLSTTTGINAKTVATTNLYTVPVSKTAIITEVIITVTAVTAITVVPTLGIGIAVGEDDIILPTALTGLNTTTKVYRFSVNGIFAKGVAGDVIKLGIDVGATATTMTISVDLIGYLK